MVANKAFTSFYTPSCFSYMLDEKTFSDLDNVTNISRMKDMYWRMKTRKVHN